jgi:hypothetical protein
MHCTVNELENSAQIDEVIRQQFRSAKYCDSPAIEEKILKFGIPLPIKIHKQILFNIYKPLQ